MFWYIIYNMLIVCDTHRLFVHICFFVIRVVHISILDIYIYIYTCGCGFSKLNKYFIIMIYKHMVQKTNANITLLYVHTHICYISMMLVIAYNCLVYQLCISALRNSGCRAAGLRVAGDFLVPRGHLNAALCRDLDGKAHRLSRVAV